MEYSRVGISKRSIGNLRESDIDCAKREFEEESGYRPEDYEIKDDIPQIM